MVEMLSGFRVVSIVLLDAPLRLHEPRSIGNERIMNKPVIFK